MRPLPRSRGFTLIELLVVMVVMIMILGLVPPMVASSLPGAKLKAAARELAAGLSQARSQAIASQREARLVLDVEERSYRVAGERREFRLPKDLELKLYTAQAELSNERQGAIRFFPDGSSTGGRVTVSYGERAYEVDVEWLTGRVRILE
jgi:general secretion pathway protein H